MAVIPIVKYGHPALSTASEDVKSWDAELEALVRDMEETMLAARGVGLAANQIGLTRRLAIIDLNPGTAESELWVLTNPEIVETSGSVKEEEGCLSIPRLVGVVERPATVRVRFRDLHGDEREVEGEGLMARALCHEIDHLGGTLYVQRMRGIAGDMARRKARKMQRQGAWEDVHP